VVESPFNAAKNHAEEFYRLGRAAGQHAILCGMELLRLQDDRGTAQGKRNDLTSSRSGTKLTWEEVIEAEVGISRTVAYRWMQAARAQLPAIGWQLGYDTQGKDTEPPTEAELIACISSYRQPERLAEVVGELTEGKTLEQLLLPLDGDGAFDPSRLTGKARDAWEKIVALCNPYDSGIAAGYGFQREHYEAWHEDALVMRKRVEAGEIPPARAWAGLRGRAATHGESRADVDHYKNLSLGLTKLRNSLAHWDELGGEERLEVEAFWQQILPALPGSWKLTLKKQEGWK